MAIRKVRICLIEIVLIEFIKYQMEDLLKIYQT